MTDRIIVSIPHTGTHFVSYRLGITDIVHSMAPWEFLLEQIEGKRIVSPLRHPMNVWKSWCKRYASSEGFAWQTWGFAWRTIEILDSMYEIDFIDLEERRDPRIEDWSPENMEHNFPNDIPQPIDFNKIFKMPFVARHYEWTDEMNVAWQTRVRKHRKLS